MRNKGMKAMAILLSMLMTLETGSGVLAAETEGSVSQAMEQAEEETKETVEESSEEEKKAAEEQPAEEEKQVTEDQPAEEEKQVTEEKPAEEETKEAGEQPAEEEKQVTEEKPAEEETKEAGEQPAEEEKQVTEEKPAEEETKETEEEPVKEEAKETVEQPAKAETKEIVEQPVKEEKKAAEEQPAEDNKTTADAGVRVVKGDGTEFAMFPISESTVSIQGKWVEISLFTSKNTYSRLYLGSNDDVEKTHVVEGTPVETGGWKFSFSVSLEEMGKTIPVCLFGIKSKDWYQKQQLYLVVPEVTSEEPEPVPDPIPVPEPTPVPDPIPVPDPVPVPDPNPGIPNGIYQTTAETGEKMFRVVDVKLTAKGGTMTALITLSGTGYDYLYLGTGAEADKADVSSWIPVKEQVSYQDENGEQKTGSSYEIPVSALDMPLAVAAHSASKNKWYDRKITIQSEGMDKIGEVSDAPENGIYQMTAETGEKMFRVVDAVLTANNGTMTALITLSGTGYDYLYLGTGAEAEKADPSSWIAVKGEASYKNENGEEKTGCQYEIPVSALDTPMAVAAHSKKNQKWYDRTITMVSEGMTKIGDLPETETGDGSGNGSESSGNGGQQTGGIENGSSAGSNTGSGASNNGNGTVIQPPANDGKADSESKYESDTSGTTGKVNSATSLADGVYTPDGFSWSGGSGRTSISCNKVTIKNGQAYATIAFSSSSYSYIKANGRKYYATVSGGKSIFVIPVALNKNNTIIGMTTKMSASHEITYSIYVYLAAADGKSSSSAENSAGTDDGKKKLDETAPQILGLTYQSETKIDHAEYFKIFHYEDGITLLEIDLTKDTARDPETKQEPGADAAAEASKKTEAKGTENQKEKTGQQEETEILNDETGEMVTAQQSQAERTAELYRADVVKYLIVPKDVEIPAGLEKDMIVIQLPADKTYVASKEAFSTLEKLELFDQIAAVNVEKEDCENPELKDAMEKEEILFAGEAEDPDYKQLVKAETNFAILSDEILPNNEEDSNEEDNSEEDNSEEKLTEEEQTERLEEILDRFATLGIPMIIDRSDKEKTELAKAEWIKIYGAVFGCENQADRLYEQAVKEAEQEK